MKIQAGQTNSQRYTFFPLGQVNFASGTPTNYFYTQDHLGSTREMTKTVSGTTTIEAQYAYDPYGIATKLQGSQDADFQYAGYYMHAPSGLNLTLFRQYNPVLGRWLSRDPIGETGGANLYTYQPNNPISFLDPFGLEQTMTIRASGPQGAPLSADFSWVNGQIDTGHTFMRLRDTGTGYDSGFYGLYPAYNPSPMQLLGPGKMKNDAATKYTDEITIPIKNFDAAKRMMEDAKKDPPPYNLKSPVSTCTTLPLDMAKVGGNPLPVKTRQPARDFPQMATPNTLLLYMQEVHRQQSAGGAR